MWGTNDDTLMNMYNINPKDMPGIENYTNVCRLHTRPIVEVICYERQKCTHKHALIIQMPTIRPFDTLPQS